jgi:hypothetical protein
MTISLMTAQQRHDAIRSISRDPDISDAEALRQIARLTPKPLPFRKRLLPGSSSIPGMTAKQWQARGDSRNFLVRRGGAPD